MTVQAEVVLKLLEKLAGVTIDDVIPLVDRNLLPAKTCVAGAVDIVAHQASSGVVLPVRHVGGKAVLLRDYPSAI